MDVRVGLYRKLSTEELMVLNCGVGEDSWESLGLLEIQPVYPKFRKLVLNIHWKDWCWNSNTLVTWWEELTHLKRPWCLGACQAPLSVGFPRQEYWSWLPFPPPGDLPKWEIEPVSLKSPGLAGRLFTTSATWEAPVFHKGLYYFTFPPTVWESFLPYIPFSVFILYGFFDDSHSRAIYNQKML